MVGPTAGPLSKTGSLHLSCENNNKRVDDLQRVDFGSFVPSWPGPAHIAKNQVAGPRSIGVPSQL
ncbi:hypothetical protein CsSME_00043564 [Camellia sinensis var. sinensis]